MQFTFNAIGIIHSPFKQKFAIPRQPRLATSAKGLLELLPPYDDPLMLQGIEDYSHLWLSFVFHQTLEQGWSAQVRPPRLGGNKKIGLFATRSTFRPNPIGLSAVKFEGVVEKEGKLYLSISGLDLLDGTPILDIKPYIPYSDKITEAAGSFAQERPEEGMQVEFTQEALNKCLQLEKNYPQLQQLIIQMLQQDPRPAYKKKDLNKQEYAVYLYELNVSWQVEQGATLVTSIAEIDKSALDKGTL